VVPVAKGTSVIDLASLSHVSPSAAAPGSLLIQAAKKPAYAAWLMIGGGGPRNTLTIDNGRYGFQVVDGHAASGVFLQVANPRFIVDPTSALSGTDSSPEAGTLFLTSKGPGILARLDRGTVRVMLDGTLTDDNDWGSFAGFRHWRIEVGDAAHDTHVLYTYRHESMDGGR
jgi:hypothetical protein